METLLLNSLNLSKNLSKTVDVVHQWLLDLPAPGPLPRRAVREAGLADQAGPVVGAVQVADDA